MSATVNADLFAGYFGHSVKAGKDVPIVEIPGKTFPVTQWFLEDILDDTGYALDATSEYARPVDFKNSGSGGTFTFSPLNQPRCAMAKMSDTPSTSPVWPYFHVYFIAGYKASMDTIYKGLGEYADCVDEADLADALATGSQVSFFVEHVTN